jgi:hypothetical protein
MFFFAVVLALLLQLYREKVVFLQQETSPDFCDDIFRVNGEPLHLVFFIFYEHLISCESKLCVFLAVALSLLFQLVP